MIILAALRGMGSKVPAWAWALIVALAWGGWQHYSAKAAGAALLARKQQEAAAQVEQMQAAQAETARRLLAQQEATNDANLKTQAALADAAGAGDAVRRLRQRIAAAQSSVRPADPAASSCGAAAAASSGVPPDLFWRVVDAAGRYAAIADQRGIAGEACERAYQALTR